jgi:hypothetical protein
MLTATLLRTMFVFQKQLVARQSMYANVQPKYVEHQLTVHAHEVQHPSYLPACTSSSA